MDPVGSDVYPDQLIYFKKKPQTKVKFFEENIDECKQEVGLAGTPIVKQSI